MKDNVEIFRDFDQIVRDQYATIPLRDLEEFSIGQENSITFFSRIVRSKQNLKPFPSSDFKLYDELLFISRDIKYYTALLYFFKPYITNSNNGTYYQTLEDRKYMMFTSIAFQSVYNFWDRIGDLLEIFFKTGLSESSIYFNRVLNNMPNEFKQSEHYKWLNSQYNSEIKQFLGQRNDIVHSYQLECEYYWRVMDAGMDTIKTREIQKEKEAFPDIFKRQIDFIIEGFERALRLIDELPNKNLMEATENSD